jgi:hypothetical protein
MPRFGCFWRFSAIALELEGEKTRRNHSSTKMCDTEKQKQQRVGEDTVQHCQYSEFLFKNGSSEKLGLVPASSLTEYKIMWDLSRT